MTTPSHPFLEALREGLGELGYAEGRDLLIEYRFAERADQLPAFAAELIGLQVDLLVAGGSEAVRAARDVTDALPIVMTNSGDPVAASLLQIRLHSLKVGGVADLASAFQIPAQEGVGALMVLRDPLMVRQMAQIVELAASSRLPAMYETRDFVDAGGLMLYGPSLTNLYRRAASYVDKIIKAAKPADLPVERPTTFDLAINLKAARLTGLTIPPSVLQQATEVIR